MRRRDGHIEDRLLQPGRLEDILAASSTAGEIARRAASTKPATPGVRSSVLKRRATRDEDGRYVYAVAP